MFGKRKQQDVSDHVLRGSRSAQRRQFDDLLAQAANDELSSRQIDNIRHNIRHNSLFSDEERSQLVALYDHACERECYPERLRQVQQQQAECDKLAATSNSSEQLLYALNQLSRRLFDHAPWTAAQITQDTGLKVTAVRDQRDQVIQVRHTKLMAARDSQRGFDELLQFMQDVKVLGLNTLAPYPDDWNDLVARYRETPYVDLFRGLPGRGSGDVRLLAAEALRTNSFTDAQIALAYCNAFDSKYRDAVGPVLTAELAKFVVREQAARAVQPSK